MEQDATMPELTQSLKTLKKNKSPGLDNITNEITQVI